MNEEAKQEKPAQEEKKDVEERWENIPKSCLIGLIEFEKAWNKDGDNQSHLYEDLRNAVVESCKFRLKSAE